MERGLSRCATSLATVRKKDLLRQSVDGDYEPNRRGQQHGVFHCDRRHLRRRAPHLSQRQTRRQQESLSRRLGSRPTWSRSPPPLRSLRSRRRPRTWCGRPRTGRGGRVDGKGRLFFSIQRSRPGLFAALQLRTVALKKWAFPVSELSFDGRCYLPDYSFCQLTQFHVGPVLRAQLGCLCSAGKMLFHVLGNLDLDVVVCLFERQ